MSRKKRVRNPGLNTVLLAAILTLAAGIIIIYLYGDRLFKTAEERPVPAAVEKTVDLYFSVDDGLYLKPEKRRIKKGSLETEATGAVRALLEGPRNGLISAIPAGTRLIGLKVRDSTAFVDFSSEIVKNHPGGSSGELETVYSIVNTLTLNFQGIKEVQILVEGKKEETLAGHIDINFPLVPDREIIKY